jgi:hypothetical protein
VETKGKRALVKKRGSKNNFFMRVQTRNIRPVLCIRLLMLKDSCVRSRIPLLKLLSVAMRIYFLLQQGQIWMNALGVRSLVSLHR